ncbi:Exodeoxyribonuclease III [Enterobacter cloacae]|uniref:Exodeoxyribonuclease III n=1 Tax=Enterobacter cloacae TaxID=550 RepID=A0A377M1P6_ENTCL|nr:Exodeoxyribonuclease III [Enterobacter cloacae]
MFPLEEVVKLGYNVFYHGQKGHYGVALLTKEDAGFRPPRLPG